MKNDKTQVTHKTRDLIYILAPSYTGSTLLTFLLSQHKDIATIGELKATSRGDLDGYLCSCGLLQRECSFWRRVAEEMRKVDASFRIDDMGTHFRSDTSLGDRVLHAGIRGRLFEFVRLSMLLVLPGCRNRLHRILERNRLIIDVICDLQQSEVFLDGSKDPIRLKLLNSAGYWNLKMIYLIRNGRGATNSCMRHHGVPMETAAKEWCRAHRECDRMVQELGNDKYITIHYEDLCRNPEETLAKICDFVALDDRSCNLRYRSSEHHILGNQMRLKSTEYIKLDERWKYDLEQEDLDVFERIAGDLNRSYGYR